MSVRVLVSCVQMQRELPAFEGMLARLGVALVVPRINGQQLSEDDLCRVVHDVDGVIAGDDPFTARVLDTAPQLRVISKWGVGTDAIDHEAAARRGVAVTNTPGVFADEVADMALGYLLLLARRQHVVDRVVRAGGWPKVEGETLRGRALGILGMGSIGRAVAPRGAAVGMTVLGADPSPAAQQAASADGIEVVDTATVFTRSDYLVLCAPLTPQTRHVVNARALRSMRRGARLVNVSRGALVDEKALVEALCSGQLAGAALDVYEDEPLPEGSPLRRLDHVVLGAHNGSNTRQAVARTSRAAVDNLLRGLGLA